jgi:hypothetical protein
VDAAGPTDSVILRNITINGIASGVNGGINGIRFISGKALHIEHCTISRFTNNGIDIALGGAGGSVYVLDTISQENAGAGLSAIASGAYTQVTIDNSRFDGNANGVSALDLYAVLHTKQPGSGQHPGWLSCAG